MIVILLGILALSLITQINAQQSFVGGCDGYDQVYNHPPPYEARADIFDYGSGSAITGWVDFSQSECYGPTRITGTLYGLPDGLHGCHVHAYGDTSNGCNSMGSHYNPYQEPHGGQADPTRHVGDLGNIGSQNGVAFVDITDFKIDLGGPNSVLGRGLVLHAYFDDEGKTSNPDSQTTGNSGPRIACGIIGMK